MRPLAFVALCLAACAHTPSGLERGTVVSGGLTRTFLATAAEAPGRPLVLLLHGRLGKPESTEEMTHLTALAQREGFVLAVPEGLGRSWADARGTTPASKGDVDDVSFLVSLIDHLAQSHHIDTRRVYVFGISNGGFMALTLACAVSERIAGVVSVVGSVSKRLSTQCVMAKPVPVAFIMGEDDPIVPYRGGMLSGGRGEVLSAEDSAAFIAKKNGAGEKSERVMLPDVDANDGTRVSLTTWPGAGEVRLYSIQGGGHTWPGGAQYLNQRIIGVTSHDLSANEEGWKFLQRFSRE